MSTTAKVNWQGDAGFELIDMFNKGESYSTITKFLYAKYGVSYTSARISQLVKQFRLEGRLPAKIVDQKEVVNVVSN